MASSSDREATRGGTPGLQALVAPAPPGDYIRAMIRRALLLSTLALLLAAAAPFSAAWAQARPFVPTAQDRADLQRVEAALNGIRTLHARFLQTAPNGAVSEGQAWLQRPGRLRFQYDPPSPFLLVGGNGLLVFNDKQLNQTSNIPLGSTPLGLLLQDNLRLSGDVTVTGMTRLPNQLQVTVVRTKSPGDGSLTLIFAEPQLALQQWVVTDAQRLETRVRLYNIEMGGTFDQKLFQFVDPRFFQNNTGGNG
jgi:outer membrane lipoprotein-sorting protein